MSTLKAVLSRAPFNVQDRNAIFSHFTSPPTAIAIASRHTNKINARGDLKAPFRRAAVDLHCRNI